MGIDSASVDAIAALADPLRLALYEHVSRSATAVSRDDAATAMAVPRGTAAFHLERLVADGLLEIEFRRTSGRTGPGSGRPAKFYRRAPGERTVSLPDRDYALAGDLLASAVEAADASGRSIRDVLGEIAQRTGREIGERCSGLSAALETSGYEPRPDGAGGYDLVNCPFHALAQRHTELICAANVELLKGLAAGSGEDERRIEFAPQQGHCCVHVATRPASDAPSKNSQPSSRQSAAD